MTFNNTAPRTRNILSKRSTHLELEQKWRVAVVVRGRYYPPGQHSTTDKEEDRPLFLRITPGRTLPPVSSASAVGASPAGRQAGRQHACQRGQGAGRRAAGWRQRGVSASEAGGALFGWGIARLCGPLPAALSGLVRLCRDWLPACPADNPRPRASTGRAGRPVAATRLRHGGGRRDGHHPRHTPPHAAASGRGPGRCSTHSSPRRAARRAAGARLPGPAGPPRPACLGGAARGAARRTQPRSVPVHRTRLDLPVPSLRGRRRRVRLARQAARPGGQLLGTYPGGHRGGRQPGGPRLGGAA